MHIKLQPLEHGANHNTPKMIVVHCMGEFIMDPHPIHASDFLDKLGYSAHALIEPIGDVIICRDDDQGAYHAKGYNQNSLGIEFLVPGHHTYGTFLEAIKSPWANDEQLKAGADVIRRWAEAYDIPESRVVRHSDVSPGRKVDPGAGFPWHSFLCQVFS